MTDQHSVLSIVIPFYNEEESIEMVCDEVHHVLSCEKGLTWEIIMVNDGSNNKIPQIMDGLVQKYENFRAVHVSPNSGQFAALQAGFDAAKGDLIATMDGDGQNDPRDIPLLLRALKMDEPCHYLSLSWFIFFIGSYITK